MELQENCNANELNAPWRSAFTPTFKASEAIKTINRNKHGPETVAKAQLGQAIGIHCAKLAPHQRVLNRSQRLMFNY
jgi:hypothetical protein